MWDKSNSNLGEGRYLSSADASALTTALSNAGLWNSATPITTYNDSVASAVTGFQEKYASQILTPNGLSYGTGYVGASTRAELNSLYGCSTPTPPTTTQCPAGYTCTPINQAPKPFVCPTGYTCTPTINPTQPTNSITSTSQINVSSPNGDETYKIGDTIPVRWNVTGTYVFIFLVPVPSNPSLGSMIMARNISDNGYYSLTIPSYVPAGNYEISISSDAPVPSNVPTLNGSSNIFTITSSTNTSQPIINGVPVITSVSSYEGINGQLTLGTGNHAYGQNMISVSGDYLVSTSGQSYPILFVGSPTGTSVGLTLPAIPSGQYNLYLTNSYGTSDPYQVIVISTTTPPSSMTNTGIPTFTNTGIQTYINSQYGLSFKYPTSFNGGFASMNSTPQVIITTDNTATGINSTDGCYDGSSPNSYKDSQLTLNNIPFCVSTTGDAGMSQRYTTYNFTTHRNGEYVTLEYVIHTPNGCGAYEGASNYAACEDFENNYSSDVVQPLQLSAGTLTFTN